MGFVVELFLRRVVDRSNHSLGLTIDPRVLGLGQPLLDLVGFTDHFEAHRSGRDRVPVPRLFGELESMVGQDDFELVWHSL